MPRRVVKPSASMRTTASKSLARQLAHTARRGAPARTARPRPIRGRRPRRRSAAPARRAAPRGTRSASSSPRRTQSSSAAHSTSSSRDSGNSRAFGHAADRVARAARRAAGRRRSSAASRAGRPGRRRRCRCRARARRWRPAPCSSPRFSRCSASSRSSFARLPWCAATALLAEPLGQVARDALGHAPRVDEHERGAVLRAPARRRARRPAPTTRSTSPPPAAPAAPRARGRAARAWPMSTMAQSARRRVDRAGADQEARDLVDRLLRRRQADAHQRLARTAPASRSSDSARWLPRLLAASAWISSTITRAHRRQHRAGPTRSRAARTATPAS